MAKKKSNSPKVIAFFSQLQRELQQVTWPTKNQTIKLTILVIVVSIVMGFYLGGLDYLFTWLMGIILNTN